MTELLNYLHSLPWVELHLHIEGTLNPELMLRLAEKNKVSIPYNTIESAIAAYNFTDLQSFLNIYFQGMNVLKNADDFYQLTVSYLESAKNDNIQHCEIFFDPQAHTVRGLVFDEVLEGIYSGLEYGQKEWGISSELIMCFLRNLSEKEAFEALKQAEPHKDKIIAVGLDSTELGNPPQKFQNVFTEARQQGYLTVAHAGEEGPADYIWQALNLLEVSRIDHGVRCLEDETLVKYLVSHSIPLTVCPLSNVRLKVFDNMKDHNLPTLLAKGLNATINSDDPAYFGGTLWQNIVALQEAFSFSSEEWKRIATNGINSSFASENRKSELIQLLKN